MSIPAIRQVLGDTVTLLANPKINALAFITISVYAGFFALIFARSQKAWRISADHFLWLLALLLLNLAQRLLRHQTSSESLILQATATLGLAVEYALYLHANARLESWPVISMKHLGSPIPYVVRSYVISIAILSIWQIPGDEPFYYHGVRRWQGIWESPNLFGSLMAVGFVMCSGQCFLRFNQMLVHKAPTTRCHCSFSIKHFSLTSDALACIAYLFCLSFIGCALYRSYSRGAWLGALCGALYFAKGVRSSYQSARPHFMLKQLCFLAILISSLLFLTGSVSHTSKSPMIHRIYSIINENDFSWRNRVSAWNGAFQIMSDNAVSGTGWNQEESWYTYYYLPSRLVESGAIRVNDVLRLGCSLGPFSIVCFLLYFWSPFEKTRRRYSDTPEKICAPHHDALLTCDKQWGSVVCRSSAVALIITFWFDGGLFNIVTGCTYWLLLACSHIDPDNRKSSA